MSNKKKKKRENKITRKSVHYIQLRTHKKWPNPLNYLSHLEVSHSKVKPIAYDVDKHLNNKWIQIRQSQVIDEFNQIHLQDIKNYFLHRVIFIRPYFIFLKMIASFSE